MTEKIQRSVDELHALHVTWRVAEITAEREARQLRLQLQQLTEKLAGRQLQQVGARARRGLRRVADRQLGLGRRSVG